MPESDTNSGPASDSPRNRRGALKSSRFVAALGVAAAIVLTFLLIEAATWIHQYARHGAMQTYKPRHVIDLYRFYRVNPEYRSRLIRVNSAGFRNDEEVPLDKAPGEIRIVMTGGSTIWGADAFPPFTGRIDNRDTIAANLERTLNAHLEAQKAGRRVRVLNAGVVGDKLFQNLIYFDQVIVKYRPDIVVSMDGHNDMDSLWLGTPHYRHGHDGPAEEEVSAMEAVTPAGRVLRKAQWHAAFWPSVDIDPYDPAYFKAMLEHVAAEFGIPMPEITEDPPEDRGGLFTDFVIQGVRAGALLDGRRCSIAVDSEEIRDRIYELLLRLAA